MENTDRVMKEPMDCDGVYCASITYHNDQVFTSLGDMLKKQDEISFKLGAGSMVPLVDQLLAFAEHGDHSNGNVECGLDEGRVRAREFLANYKEELQTKLKELGIVVAVSPSEEKVVKMPKVLNKKDGNIPTDAVFVGRPSKWGNHFRIGVDGTREEVVAKYADWLDGMVHNDLLDLDELAGKDLVCYCAPLPCHADVLLALANA